MQAPRLVVAGTGSGVGKTTVAVGLIGALARRGLRVQPFKVGPDFIDPSYHTLAAGRPGRSLDSWICGIPLMQRLFRRAAAPADLAVVEGVMGLFDGYAPDGDAGSTAEVAKALQCPVLLVVDAAGMARSAAALVHGFARFDPGLRVAGVIFNRVGGAGHYRLLQEALAAAAPAFGGQAPPAVGWLPDRADLRTPERHLGLVPAVERPEAAQFAAAASDLVAATVDLDAVERIARQAGPLPAPAELRPVPDGAAAGPGWPFPDQPAPTRCRIAVAQDAAFSFYYQDGLDLLAALGAELVPFSPLVDPALPPGIGALYLGGGFPEVYREALSANTPMRESVRRAVLGGLPTLAECGGMMYLCRSIAGTDGAPSPMAGVLPVTVRMQDRFAALGYARATLLQDTLLGPAGTELVGHEFHFSVAEGRPDGWPPAYRLEGRGAARLDGYARPGLLAGYLHLHLCANPEAARRLAAAAQAYQGGQPA